MFGLQGDTVYSHLGDKPGNQVGDSQPGDTTLSFGYLGDSVGSVIYSVSKILMRVLLYIVSGSQVSVYVCREFCTCYCRAMLAQSAVMRQ